MARRKRDLPPPERRLGFLPGLGAPPSPTPAPEAPRSVAAPGEPAAPPSEGSGWDHPLLALTVDELCKLPNPPEFELSSPGLPPVFFVYTRSEYAAHVAAGHVVLSPLEQEALLDAQRDGHLPPDFVRVLCETKLVFPGAKLQEIIPRVGAADRAGQGSATGRPTRSGSSSPAGAGTAP